MAPQKSVIEPYLFFEGRCEHPMKFRGFALSLEMNTEAEADKYFNALTQGGQVMMPLSKTFWSPRFGMVTDKFGIMGMINILTGQES